MLNVLFPAVLRMSLHGAAAALLVWLACRLLRRLGAPRAICCALWLAVLACLVLPAGVPVPAGGAASAAVSAAIDEAALRFVQRSAAGAAAAAPGNTLSLRMLPAAVWLGGVLAMAAGSLLAALRLRRRVALAYRADSPDGCYYTGRCVDTPFAAGLLRPRIYLPAGLSPAQRQYILLHEQAHLRRCDHWIRPLFYAALCLHWFNPLAWLAWREMVLDMESACDEAVLRRLGDTVKPDYCQSLLRFAVRRGPAAPPAFGESDLKARIRRILDYRRPGALSVAGSAALACAVAAVCLLRPAQPAPEPAAASGFDAGSTVPAALPADSTLSAAAEALIWPVPDYSHVSRWMSDGHKGVDICAAEGADVLAAAPGVVIAAGYDAAGTGFGYSVVISHGDGLYTVYGHCSALYVQTGQAVGQGDRIAAVGNTGNSTGNHLHLGIFRADDTAGSAAASDAEALTHTYLDPQEWFTDK